MIFGDSDFGNLSCLKHETAINIPETPNMAPLQVLENLGRKAHVNDSLHRGASLGSLFVQSNYDR
jgi:hypothetical protein